MQYMEVQGTQYPIIEQVERKNGDIVSMLDIPMMSDEKWQRTAEEQAIKNFRKWYGRDPISVEEAFKGQRTYIDRNFSEVSRTEKGAFIMQFPLTEEMFYSLEWSEPIDKKFIRAFINAVNVWYEEGTKAERSGFCVTADILKTVYEQIYNEKPEGGADAQFFDITAKYMNDAWWHGVKDSGKVFDIPLAEIQIDPCFAETPPNPLKMKRKAYYFKETGHFHSDIVLDEDNNLIDGYTSYLLAKQSGMECVPIRYGKRQIVSAYHRQGGKLYERELPEWLIDKVSPGDRVLVHTEKGFHFVTVETVEPYKPRKNTKPLRMAVKVRKAVRHD